MDHPIQPVAKGSGASRPPTKSSPLMKSWHYISTRLLMGQFSKMVIMADVSSFCFEFLIGFLMLKVSQFIFKEERIVPCCLTSDPLHLYTGNSRGCGPVFLGNVGGPAHPTSLASFIWQPHSWHHMKRELTCPLPVHLPSNFLFFPRDSTPWWLFLKSVPGTGGAMPSLLGFPSSLCSCITLCPNSWVSGPAHSDLGSFDSKKCLPHH